MIPEEFVTFETAKLLKEAGFPQYKSVTEYECCLRPTQSQAMRWLREERKIIVSPDYKYDGAWWVKLMSQKFSLYKVFTNSEDNYPTYEAAAEEGIQAACKYLIEKNKEQ